MSSVNRDEPADLMDYDAYGSPELFIMEDIDCPGKACPVQFFRAPS